MATSALDLLLALDARLDDLEATTMVPGSIERVRREWRALARTSLRLLDARPRHPADGAQRLVLLLASMADPADVRPLPDPGTGLMAITTTIGCLTDVMRIPTVSTPHTQQQAADAIGTNLESALVRAARWTERGFDALGAELEPQLARLAGLQPEAPKPAAVHAWRIIGPSDSGIDGAIARWETAATDAILSPRLVTQHALQLGAADIALLCAAANTITEHASEDRTGGVSALLAAARAWRQAARWPSHLRLGGRSTELRHASAELRQTLDDALRTGSEWKQPDEMFADTSAERFLAMAHSGLQSATRVGHAVVAALDSLTHGASRVWLNADQIPMPRHSVQKALDSLRYDWWPDPATFHSAETVHHNAAEALTKLARATPLTIEALGLTSSRTPEADDLEELWETVPAVLDPLRAAQDLARRAAIAPAEPPAHTVGI
jgi:hypothetical protein